MKAEQGNDKSAPGYTHPHIAHHYPSGIMQRIFPQYHRLAAVITGEVKTQKHKLEIEVGNSEVPLVPTLPYKMILYGHDIRKKI